MKVKTDSFYVCVQVSGQENTPRGQRLLTSPLWSHTLGISPQCQYENKPTAESCSSPTGTL